MGANLEQGPGLDLIVAEVSLLSDEQIIHSLRRCRIEIGPTEGPNGRFPPKLGLRDILERAGVAIRGKSADDAEASAAFDLAMRVAAKYSFDGVLRDLGSIDKDCQQCGGGGHVIQIADNGDRLAVRCPCRKKDAVPTLTTRITDTVHRLGGWEIFKVPPEKFSFVRRDFLLEYGKWEQVERQKFLLQSGSDLSRLTIGDLKGLLPN